MSVSHPTAPAKPSKPYPDFPLFPHATGRWAKKIRGKLHYFGPWDDPDGALKKYQAEAADLHAGRAPRLAPEALTVYVLCAKFLTARKQAVDAGELKARTFAEYTATCRRIIRAFGKGRRVDDLRPDDFARLRADMAKRWGPVRLKAEVIRTRTPFNWAAKNLLLSSPVAFGEAFRVPSAKTLRVHRATRGPKMFEAEEIRRMLRAAGQPLKAMVLLALNAGFGNNDVATLPLSAVDLERGWITHARPKTGITRRCPLWPETVAALRDWLAVRPEPKNTDHAGLAFVTYKRGSWLDNEANRALSHETRKLLDSLGINGHRGFYSLRHTFQTVGDESGDFLAVRSIMGHAGGNDVADHYRERVSDGRLGKVVNHVRGWLFGGTEAGA